MESPIIVITGPTASGKTAISVEMAKKFGGEIINADSRSIYKEMDLGTGKPTMTEREGIPHHLFDVVSPNEQFSVAEYKKMAEEKIAEIRSRGNVPIIAGGTMMYIDAVVYDYEMSDAKPDSMLRNKLAQKSTEEIFAELEKNDPETAVSIDARNRHRLIRALEVFYETGKPAANGKRKAKLPTNVLYLAIDRDREELYAIINRRVKKWMAEDFVDEVKNLLKKYSLDDPGMSGIGYKQVGLYLKGDITLEEATDKFQQGDRNLAKRQLTWLRRNKDVVWIKDKKEAEDKIKKFLI